jgi:hypothetical protein
MFGPKIENHKNNEAGIDFVPFECVLKVLFV